MFPRSPALNTTRNQRKANETKTCLWFYPHFHWTVGPEVGYEDGKWERSHPVCTIQVLTTEVKADRPLTEIVSIEGHIDKTYSSQNKGNFFCFKPP